ncbi:MAG: energy-coupling factor ABC transporter permease [Candidatus Heimdallarchaeota archaeon]|nr:energy-coupling factor ABC transporter permease [Candidatus Heimdallarchaeota archaeon]
MHMPDGILPLNHAIVYLAVAGVMILIAIWQSRKSLTLKQIPIIGVLAAGLFAAQMFNFPVPFGSSGHLIGTALATVLVGPWVGILIISAILLVQAFFGDGGFLAFGVNNFNMAIVGAFTVVAVFYLIPQKWREKRFAFAGFAAGAAFISTILMSLAASAELAIAQTGPPALIFGWMVGLHAIIGLAEAAITFAVVSFVFLAEPGLLKAAENSLFMRRVDQEDKMPTYRFPVLAIASSVIVFGIMAIFGIIASENPDGLERTFEFLQDAGYSISESESGLFGLPEGLGWAILQMAIVMVIILGVILLTNFIVYRVKRRNYLKTHTIIDEQASEGKENTQTSNESIEEVGN